MNGVVTVPEICIHSFIYLSKSIANDSEPPSLDLQKNGMIDRVEGSRQVKWSQCAHSALVTVDSLDLSYCYGC